MRNLSKFMALQEYCYRKGLTKRWSVSKARICQIARKETGTFIKGYRKTIHDYFNLLLKNGDLKGNRFVDDRLKKRVSARKQKVKPTFTGNKDFYKSWAWKDLRFRVLLEYGATCMLCGATKDSGAIICVDHIKPRRLHPDLELEFDNMQVLCNDCNMGKSYKYETDFRPNIH